MTVIERFLKYVSFDTQSDENSGVTPSTPKQMVFAQYLKSELEQLGFQEISLDENGYLFATWPANTDKPVPAIGFIAHMDTSPDMTGAGVTPRIVYGYDGTDIVLCEEDNVILSPKQFPELLDHKGEDLIVTNGKTLLGADDKAGIAEIISAMVYLKEHPEIKHGKIRVGFNPDEEIGLGAHKFDVERFGCEWAYTMDGRPFYMTNVQVRLDKLYGYEGWNDSELEAVMEQAASDGFNTVSIPVFWREVEPEKDLFDWRILDKYMGWCKKYGMKMELLWFSWSSGGRVQYLWNCNGRKELRTPDYVCSIDGTSEFNMLQKTFRIFVGLARHGPARP